MPIEIVDPTGSPIAPGQGRTIIFVHGRHFKPSKSELSQLWFDAARTAIERDWPTKLEAYDSVAKEFAYYGDCTNRVLQDTQDYDPIVDVADRKNALERLKKLPKAKRFKRDVYEKLPGKTPFKEFLADFGAPLLGASLIKDRVVARIAPEIGAYWDADRGYRSEVDQRVRDPLEHALDRRDQVLVIAHCLGSVAAYNVLWQLSHDAGADDRGKVECLITFGSPLGDNTVKSRLDGAGEQGAARYPSNVLNWHNVSAEDDYMCHDKNVADDFKPMLTHHLISQIRDYRMYNLAVRFGRSNPHCSLGYLMHPRMARLIADWVEPAT